MAEWLAFWELEPWGGSADDDRLAYQVAVLSNTIGGGKDAGGTKREPYQVRDFQRQRGPARAAKPARMTPEATTAHVLAIFAPLGATLPPGGA